MALLAKQRQQVRAYGDRPKIALSRSLSFPTPVLGKDRLTSQFRRLVLVYNAIRSVRGTEFSHRLSLQ